MLSQLRSTSEPILLGADGGPRRAPGGDSADGGRRMRRTGSEPGMDGAEGPTLPPDAAGPRAYGRSWRAGRGPLLASAHGVEAFASFRGRGLAGSGSGSGSGLLGLMGASNVGAGGSGRALTPPPLTTAGSHSSFDSDIQRAESASRRSFADSRAAGSTGRHEPGRPVIPLPRATSRRSGGSGSGTAGSGGTRGSGNRIGRVWRRRAAFRSRAPPWDLASAARHGPVVRATWARVTKALSWDQASAERRAAGGGRARYARIGPAGS